MTGTKANSAEARKVPPVERILTERVIACKFFLVQAECAVANAKTFRSQEQLDRCVDRAHRRLLSAVKTLAEVKRLGVPQVNVAMPGAMQLNVGEKQVNASMTPVAIMG